MPASELNIYCLELHHIHIALLFFPHIQVFYLKKKRYSREVWRRSVWFSQQIVFRYTLFSTPTLSWGSIYANVQYPKDSFCPVEYTDILDYNAPVLSMRLEQQANNSIGWTIHKSSIASHRSIGYNWMSASEDSLWALWSSSDANPHETPKCYGRQALH